MTEANPETKSTPTIGRNEPCPCGSGKKYKRCHGVSAAPKLSTPQAPAFPAGMDPEALKSQFDPQMMTQFSQMLGRLPKGQLQKLQNLMQKAMAGKDVTREAKEFEGSLPTELQTLLAGFQMPNMSGMPGLGMPDLSADAAPSGDVVPDGMSEEEARKIVEAAAKAGKISSDEASSLLQAPPGGAGTDSKGGFSKIWKKISGK